jgi:hypothetical protein
MEKLETAQNIWIASVRPDGRPHLTPVWFAWTGGKLYVSIDPDSVKSKNIAHTPHVALALEDGLHLSSARYGRPGTTVAGGSFRGLSAEVRMGYHPGEAVSPGGRGYPSEVARINTYYRYNALSACRDA